jgi:4-aminobutyrate aminotransferase-like enzyme
LAQEAIQIIIDEKLVENSLKMGERLFNGIKGFKSHKHVKDVRGEGRGLFMAIEFEKDAPEGFYLIINTLGSDGTLL